MSAAFYPLRDLDPETVDLPRLRALLPAESHFSVVQFPFNYAEPHALLRKLNGADAKPLLA